MPKLFEIGTVVVITHGRRAGKKAVVVDIIDENYVLITGPKSLNGIKRRRMNISHLMPINLNFEIDRGADDGEILGAIEERNLEDTMKEEVGIPLHRL